MTEIELGRNLIHWPRFTPADDANAVLAAGWNRYGGGMTTNVFGFEEHLGGRLSGSTRLDYTFTRGGGVLPTVVELVCRGMAAPGDATYADTGVGVLVDTPARNYLTPTMKKWSSGVDSQGGRARVTEELATYTFTFNMPVGSGGRILRVFSMDGGADIDLVAARLYFPGEPDGLGVFDGDTQDTDSVRYVWAGDPFNSESIAYEVYQEPEPDTEVEPTGPTFTDNVEEGGGEWTSPYEEGISYSPQNGEADPGETVTITATAIEGYVLTGVTQWQHTYPLTPEPEEPDPEEPDPEEPDPEEPEVPDLTSPAINLVPRPLTPGGYINTASPAWVESTPDLRPAPVGGQNRMGQTIYGIALDNTTANALIEVPEGYGLDPLAPGDELAIWLTGSDTVTAGLYRDRTATADAQVSIDPKSHEEPGAILSVPEGDGDLWLKLQGGSLAAASAVRLSPAYPVDSLGIFDGTEEGTDLVTYDWTGAAELSPSVAIPAGWEPEAPEPEPVDPGEVVTALAHSVVAYLDGEEELALVQSHVPVVMAYVYGYTRGRGFTDGVPGADLQQVIVAATARLSANPSQVEYYQTGDYSERPARLTGWTLLELAVLNQYRVRWA